MLLLLRENSSTAETLEAQFIAEVKQKINESPTYSLEQLNLDLANYLKNQYFERIHGGTHAKPIDRFHQTVLPPPNPPLEVEKFLERTESRNVNKFREISYQGYKIQVDLVPGSKVHVIDMLESIRIEYQDQFIREINKVDLIKTPSIKIQDGISELIKTERSATKPDQDGYYHRIVSTAGTFKIGDECYYLDKKRKGQKLLIQLTMNNVRIYDNEKKIIESLEKKTHKADFIDLILTKANQ